MIVEYKITEIISEKVLLHGSKYNFLEVTGNSKYKNKDYKFNKIIDDITWNEIKEKGYYLQGEPIQ